ncbi:DNA polymerase I [Lentilactobacillus parabuchneri]|jgi:DNA polymerase-1|uniref:DNA polymerase I n=2 Tax=Lentilactobacillus parabuchneri TaxID=152331 RepID=A0A1X1FBF7_9LACO|nr:DNA polymerase I [Lentilactobacillus parabuchneri]KRM47953.1 DNA polymerase I [Lentilactobacillus parabuchneri DSM 5707 = NBRC 107865]KRN74574.1 DNA polymerase I [Lentilactobacillus parabuchneri]MBW0222029.1 DNA polymerase I [Lentilactobacillus parabuchneri]MBW0244747.1 DNA polymerase I [Lentilactobacillus parabuchneri]MBW0262825.1 DNA polymerase I [Lentilactobacillus parabuchneri]
MTKKLLLIDGNSIAFKAFYALYTAMDKFTNPSGLHTSAIYGFNRMLDKVLDDEQPTDVLVAFDAGKVTFRTKMFADYKGGRAKTPTELSEQFPFIKELVNDRGIATYELPDYEADDIIGTLAKQAEDSGDYEVVIVTGDRDLTQLTSDKTTVQVSKKGVTELETYTPKHVEEKLGVKPSQIIEIKGLKGDNSDNYPGVEKVGDKTALKLIQQFGTIDNLYQNIDDVSGKKLKEHLIQDEDQARRAHKLATINREAPITISLADLNYKGDDIDKLTDFYERMGFKSFLAKLSVDDNDHSEDQSKIEYTVLTKDNLSELDQFKDEVSFHLEMSEENYHISPLIGFAVGQGDHWYVTNQPELLKDPHVSRLLTSETVKKNLFDAKRTFVGLYRQSIILKNVDFDMLLVSYLLNTTNNSNDVGTVAHLHGFYNIKTDEEVYGKGAKRQIDAQSPEFLAHIVHKAKAIDQLHDDMFKDLDEHNQTTLYRDIEIKIAFVLAKMEINGIKVDAGTLEAMGSKFKERIAEIQQTIYQEAGEEFNIGSPKQLGKILFEKLRLPILKKTKTGYSTSVDVLEKLAPDAPIVQNVLDYRQIAKLQSTYIDGLLKVIHKDDGKVHTRYLQTLTQTGRLSSVDPNLQNIPIRTEEGRLIRQAFVPTQPGWQIFSSDYSQIELRVLASITGDQNMQEAFKEGEDIHATTARRIFGLPSNEAVTPELRRQAKAVNFGIVYGISDFGLSQNTGITRKQAHQFIERYFEEYPGVKKYMDDIVKFARNHRYVETIAHRRRYLPDINSKSFNLRSFAERTAMNTPIQGSAADIIKIAMINMNEAIKDMKTKMLLQVHDELIFEVPNDELETVKKLIPSVMDSAIKLDVPLKVESHWGKTWYDAK